jgi:hypothetical protein
LITKDYNSKIDTITETTGPTDPQIVN